MQCSCSPSAVASGCVRRCRLITCVTCSTFVCLASVSAVLFFFLTIWVRDDVGNPTGMVNPTFSINLQVKETCPPTADVTERITFKCSETGGYSGGSRTLLLSVRNVSLTVFPDPDTWSYTIVSMDGSYTELQWQRRGDALQCPTEFVVEAHYPAPIALLPALSSRGPCACDNSSTGCESRVALWDPQIQHNPYPVESIDLSLDWPENAGKPCIMEPEGVLNGTQAKWSVSGDLPDAFELGVEMPRSTRMCVADGGLAPELQRAFSGKETMAVVVLAFSTVCLLSAALALVGEMSGRLYPLSSASFKELAGDDAGFVDPSPPVLPQLRIAAAAAAAAAAIHGAQQQQAGGEEEGGEEAEEEEEGEEDTEDGADQLRAAAPASAPAPTSIRTKSAAVLGVSNTSPAPGTGAPGTAKAPPGSWSKVQAAPPPSHTPPLPAPGSGGSARLFGGLQSPDPRAPVQHRPRQRSKKGKGIFACCCNGSDGEPPTPVRPEAPLSQKAAPPPPHKAAPAPGPLPPAPPPQSHKAPPP
eukprot:Hpha_TRINITY_DN15887_c1_g6::TRINITY_DN15887_c1_g6_i1::g.189710::m.189710